MLLRAPRLSLLVQTTARGCHHWRPVGLPPSHAADEYARRLSIDELQAKLDEHGIEHAHLKHMVASTRMHRAVLALKLRNPSAVASAVRPQVQELIRDREGGAGHHGRRGAPWAAACMAEKDLRTLARLHSVPFMLRQQYTLLTPR